MINKVTLIGNLGRDPEVRKLENGTSVGRFSVATTDSYKDKDGNWQKQTEWHNVVVWRDLADRAEQHLQKGSTVYIEGKITYRNYIDKLGAEKTSTDIVCHTFRLLEKKQARPATDPGQEYQAAEAGNYQSLQPTDGDDLPF